MAGKAIPAVERLRLPDPKKWGAEAAAKGEVNGERVVEERSQAAEIPLRIQTFHSLAQVEFVPRLHVSRWSCDLMLDWLHGASLSRMRT